MNEKKHIDIQNLSIGYRNGKKVNLVAPQLNSAIYPGELVCLLGANGTGKSTLLRTICGFQPSIEGQVLLGNKAVNELDEKRLSKLLSVVLTEKVSIPNATVAELVAYGRSPYTGLLGKINTKDKRLVIEAIKQCGIEHKTNDPLNSLSDGERQKAFIAKALAQDTPIIILDEPTAFLDLPARVEIIQLLRKVASEAQKSVLLSTHDLDLALQMADKLWLLKKGGPLISGSPEDLLLNNAFQDMFLNQGVVFDTKTGLFRVEYEHNAELAVKGRGFEYVLLHRAFARKGIKTIPHNNETDTWVEILQNEENPFRLYKSGNLMHTEKSVEKIVQSTLLNYTGLHEN